MADQEKTTDVGQSVGNAARSTADGIKTAKRIAENAAAGNVAGAAVEAAKNPKAVIAIILVITMIPILLGAALFYAAPMAMYETLQSLAEQIREQWDRIKADFYSGDGGVLERLGNAAGGLLSRMWSTTTSSLKDLWNTITAKQASEDSDDISDADIGVMGVTQDAVDVYKRKVDAVKDKLTARTEQISSKIEASCNGSIGDPGCVNGWIFLNLYSARDYGMYKTYDANWWANENNYEPGVEMPDNVVEVVYGGVTPIISKQSVKTRSAVDLIALYSALRNTTAENVKVYELMKWMGYKGVGKGTDYFVVGDVITIGMESWTGTFMPKYLEDERATLANHNQFMDIFGANSRIAETYADLTVFGDYQAPAVDLIITVGSSPLAGLQPKVTMEKIQHWEKVKNPYTTLEYGSWTSYLDYTSFPASWQNNKYVTGTVNVDWVFKFIDGYLCKVPLNNAACQGWLNLYGAVQHPYSYEVDHPAEFGYVERNRAVISYSMSASIGVRGTSSLVGLAGFADRPRPEPDFNADEEVAEVPGGENAA